MDFVEEEEIDSPKRPSLMVAGCVSLMLVFNNPSGHQALHDMAVMTYFAPAWVSAMKSVERYMPFNEFRDGAQVYQMLYHNNNVDFMIRDLKMLYSQSPLCIPFADTGDGNDRPINDPVMPCHVAGIRDKKKGLESSPKLS